MVLFCRKDFVRFALKVLQCKYEENVKSVENIIIITKYTLILTSIPFRWKGIIVYFAYIFIFLDIYTFSDYLVNWYYLTLFFLIVSYGYNAKRNWKQKTYLQCMNTRVVPNQSIQFILKILFLKKLFSPGHTTRGRWIIIDIYHF